jgi:uncharacterized membrane protein
VVVDAPIDACFAMWSDWTKLVDFMDLIGQVQTIRSRLLQSAAAAGAAAAAVLYWRINSWCMSCSCKQ